MKSTKHITVQARIFDYAEAIGWPFVSREEADQMCGFDPEIPFTTGAKNSAFQHELMTAKPRVHELLVTT